MLRYVRLIIVLFLITICMSVVCYIVSVNMRHYETRHVGAVSAKETTDITMKRSSEEVKKVDETTRSNALISETTGESTTETNNNTTMSENTEDKSQETTEISIDQSAFIKSIKICPQKKTPFFTWNQDEGISVKKGAAFYLKAKVKPKAAADTPIEWVSDNENVVKVLEDGKVCAKQCGTATIKAISSDPGRVEDSVTINVKRIDKEDAVLVAHRGKCDEAPENSLSAIELALQEGNADVEFDIWETIDHEFVVSHNESLLDCCGVDVKVTDLSLQDAMQYHITKGSQIEQYSDETIPSFKQVLEIAKEYDGNIHIELKQEFSKKMLSKLRKLIQKYEMRERVKIITFSRKNILRMRELEEDGISFELEYLSSKWDEDVLSFCEENKVGLGIQHTRVDRDMVSVCHEHGIEVNAWTVDDFEEAYQMVYDYKVDAVTSDYFLFE